MREGDIVDLCVPYQHIHLSSRCCDVGSPHCVQAEEADDTIPLSAIMRVEA